VLFLKCTGWSKSHATHIKIFIDGCNSVQFDWINKHTISLWLFKSPCRSRHVVTCLRQTVSCLSTVEVQGCIFHKCNKYSLSNTTWHSFLLNVPEWVWGHILLCQTNRQYLVWWTVSVTQEACRTETVPVDLRCWVTILWTISVKLCYALHESHWENFVFRVEYPTKCT
jgi:hypothetical protein